MIQFILFIALILFVIYFEKRDTNVSPFKSKPKMSTKEWYYNVYLKSPKWRETRLEALKSA